MPSEPFRITCLGAITRLSNSILDSWGYSREKATIAQRNWNTLFAEEQRTTHWQWKITNPFCASSLKVQNLGNLLPQPISSSGALRCRLELSISWVARTRHSSPQIMRWSSPMMNSSIGILALSMKFEATCYCTKIGKKARKI